MTKRSKIKNGKGNSRLSEEGFTLQAILNLRKDGYKGIHAVYSGFNAAFREYFGSDPVAVMEKLAKAGKIVVRPARGGVTIYRPEDAPDYLVKSNKKSGVANPVLEKILG